MTQNPFGEGGNPFGNLDLGAMLQQAQQMQEQLMAAQAELAETIVAGSAGGVSVNLTGTGELTGVTIAPGVIFSADPSLICAGSSSGFCTASSASTMVRNAGSTRAPIGFCAR